MLLGLPKHVRNQAMNQSPTFIRACGATSTIIANAYAVKMAWVFIDLNIGRVS